jgi:DNA-binding NtrC family response regulator
MNSKQSSILIIEDDPTYIQVLTYELKNLGWKVDSVNSIKEAQNYVTTHQPEIIVSDVFLSDGSGIVLSQEFIKSAPNSLVILITGYPDINQAINSLGGNVYDYLLKPFKIEQLILVIERARMTYFLKQEIEQLKLENIQFREIIIENGLNPENILKENSEHISGNFRVPNEIYSKQVRKYRTPIMKKSRKNKEN